MAVAMGLAGCSVSPASSASGTTPTVTVWSWRSQDAPVWKAAEAALAKQGTKINIKFRSINATSYDSVLQTAMNGGSGPDILYDRAGEGTERYASAKLIKPLNDIANPSSINKAALAAAMYNGKTYGVPFAVQTMSLYYNPALLKASGVSTPQTWDELLSAMKTLKAKGVTPMYMMGVQQWLLALQIDAVGASTMSSSFTQSLTEKKASYADTPYVDTLAAFHQLEPYLEDNWEATGSAGNEQETAFALGKCAFIIDGIFDTATINKVAPSLKYAQMLVPSPNGSAPKMDWYVDGNISLNAKIANSEESKAAEKVVAFASSKAFGDAFSDIAGEISPIAGVAIPTKYPLSVEAAKWYNTKAIRPIFGIRSPMDTPDPDPESLKKATTATVPGIFAAEQKIAVPVLQGKMTPKQAAESVQSDMKWYFGTSK